MAIQFQAIGKILGIFAWSNQLDDGEKLLMPIIFLLFFEYKHKMMAETGLLRRTKWKEQRGVLR